MSKTKCMHDYKYEATIKKTWNHGSDGRNGSSSGSEEKAIFKCSLCGELKSFGMDD